MTLYSLVILIAALIFLYPLSRFRKIYALTKGLRYGAYWIALSVFCVFFFVSYLLAAFHGHLIGHSEASFHATTVAILGFGSLFVALVAQLFFKIISSLDVIVDRRTDELRKAYDETLAREKENQQMKDQFLFVAAHELRTPVTAIKWNVDYLCSEVRVGHKCTEEQVEILQDLSKNNEYLIALVNDLLDTSRMEHGSFKLKKTKVDLSQVIEDAVNTVFALAQERAIELKWSLDKGIGQVNTDARRLKEVIVNLLSNSIKYNKEGGKVSLEARKRGKGLVISVKDNGIGIAPENLDKLFVKFYRVEDETGEDVRGTGLGLYISREIVERLGGELWAESEGLGKGSTFSFTLPM